MFPSRFDRTNAIDPSLSLLGRYSPTFKTQLHFQRAGWRPSASRAAALRDGPVHHMESFVRFIFHNKPPVLGSVSLLASKIQRTAATSFSCASRRTRAQRQRVAPRDAAADSDVGGCSLESRGARASVLRPRCGSLQKTSSQPQGGDLREARSALHRRDPRRPTTGRGLSGLWLC